MYVLRTHIVDDDSGSVSVPVKTPGDQSKEPEVPVNRTDVVTDFHLCYEIDNFNYLLTYRTSIVCVLFYIFLALLAVITVCGNLLVIISIIYFKQLHTPTNSLILSLAVADLLVGIVVFPISIAFPFSSCRYYNSLFCKVRDCFDITLITSSILNLCCISVDRYHAVCQPLTYQTKMSHRVVVIMILVTWLVSGFIGISVIVSGLNKCEEKCFIYVIMANTVAPLLIFYLPVIIMLCIYLKIFLVAQKQARSIQNTTKSGPTVSKTKNKATKTLAIVMGVFLLCWTPFFLYSFFVPFTNNPGPVSVMETLIWLSLSNSMLNPLIYAFFYSWFRSAFRMIISGKIFQGDFTNTKLL